MMFNQGYSSFGGEEGEESEEGSNRVEEAAVMDQGLQALGPGAEFQQQYNVINDAANKPVPSPRTIQETIEHAKQPVDPQTTRPSRMAPYNLPLHEVRTRMKQDQNMSGSRREQQLPRPNADHGRPIAQGLTARVAASNGGSQSPNHPSRRWNISQSTSLIGQPG